MEPYVNYGSPSCKSSDLHLRGTKLAFNYISAVIRFPSPLYRGAAPVHPLPSIPRGRPCPASARRCVDIFPRFATTCSQVSTLSHFALTTEKKIGSARLSFWWQLSFIVMCHQKRSWANPIFQSMFFFNILRPFKITGLMAVGLFTDATNFCSFLI